MVYVIRLWLTGDGIFDPTWYSPTVTALACLEVHLACVCAALPIFRPVLTATWNRIFVKYEVRVTQERGPFPTSRTGCAKIDFSGPGPGGDVELQPATSSAAPVDCGNVAAADAKPPHISDGWEPFVGDETTGLGENETVVRATKTKRRRIMRLFGL